MKCRISIILILLLALAAPGCDSSDSKDSGKKGPGIITTPDTGGNTPKPDAGGNNHGNLDPAEVPDADTKSPGEDTKGPGADTKSPGEDTQSPKPDATEDEDTGFVFNPFDATLPDTTGPGVSGQCNNIQDLGTLSVGSQLIQVIYSRENNDGVRTSCRSFDAPTKPEKVFKFQLAQRAKIKVTGASNYTFEIREDPCGEESSILSCNPAGHLETRNFPADKDFYLIVEDEAVLDENSFTSESENLFTLEINDMFGGVECQPGQSECVASSNDVRICSSLAILETKTCPGACVDGACIGDTCENPIILVDGTANITADIAAFGNKLPSYSCGQSGDLGRPLGAQDVVFLARNVAVGQTIHVSASADVPFSPSIVIQRDACGIAADCAYFSLSSESSKDYVAQVAGDYYVIIDGQEAFIGGNINYSVSVN